MIAWSANALVFYQIELECVIPGDLYHYAYGLFQERLFLFLSKVSL